MYETLKIMGYDVFVNDISAIKLDPEKKQVINTINPHSYVTAKDDLAFKEALQASDTLLPDGSGIVMAAKQVNGENIHKIAGSDLHVYLLAKLNETGGSVFYMGASQHTLDKIHERIAEEYPTVKVGSYSPPFKETFSKDENDEIIAKVNEAGGEELARTDTMVVFKLP